MKEPENMESDGELSGRLSGLLREEPAETGSHIPAHINDRIMAIADTKAALIRRERQNRRMSRVLVASAAAAAIIVAAFIIVPGRYGWQVFPAVSQTAGISRTPDIVDAYLMARDVRAGKSLTVDQDLNKDGHVDGADVLELVSRVVSVSAKGDAVL